MVDHNTGFFACAGFDAEKETVFFRAQIVEDRRETPRLDRVCGRNRFSLRAPYRVRAQIDDDLTVTYAEPVAVRERAAYLASEGFAV